jgi:hypothetical protein
MPEYKAISGLPVASSVNGTDKVLIQQGAITKNASVDLITAYLETSSSARIDDLEDRADALEARADAVEARVDELESISVRWVDLATRWSTPPVLTASIAAGGVYSYVYDAVTYYRLVPSPYVSSNDSFYTTFSGGVLSGLIVARG